MTGLSLSFEGGRVVMRLGAARPLRPPSCQECRAELRTGHAEVRMTPAEAEDLGRELAAIAAGCFMGDA